jgi:hypothetical protein
MRPSEENNNGKNVHANRGEVGMSDQNKKELLGFDDENVRNGVDDLAEDEGRYGLEREGGMGSGIEFSRAYAKENEEDEVWDEEEEEEIGDSRFDDDSDEEQVPSKKRGSTGESKTGGTGGSGSLSKKTGKGSNKSGMTENTRYNDHSIH